MNADLGISFINEGREYLNICQILRERNYSGELNEQEYSWLCTHEAELWDEYLKFRQSFRNDANEEKEIDFPIYIVVEPSVICNLRCTMCFQNDDELRKSGGGCMDVDLWKKVIDEAVENGCKALTIAGRGEPLINKHIVEMLDYLKDKFLEIKLNTNGLLMNDDVIRSILRNNICVVFSAEGSNEVEYLNVRKGGDFNVLVDNIKRFHQLRKIEFPDSISKSRICGVAFDSINTTKYYEFWAEIVDEVAITQYEERKDTYNNKITTQRNRCARLWQRIYVWCDGDISPCDVDYLKKLTMGNVNNNSIREIWNGRDFMKIRRLHHCGEREKINPCNRCDFTNI